MNVADCGPGRGTEQTVFCDGGRGRPLLLRLQGLVVLLMLMLMLLVLLELLELLLRLLMLVRLLLGLLLQLWLRLLLWLLLLLLLFRQLCRHQGIDVYLHQLRLQESGVGPAY